MKFFASILLISTMFCEPALALPSETASATATANTSASHSAAFTATQAPTEKPDELQRLWSLTAGPRLARMPANQEEFYNYGELLMVPLHAAFRLKNQAWLQAFSDHFSMLMSNPSVLPKSALHRLQYLYLASEFVMLASGSGQDNLIPRGLPELLFNEDDSAWRTKPAWLWEHPDFHGMRERVLYKLSTPNPKRGYYRSINDESLFVFAIAADLKAFTRQNPRPAWNSSLDDILSIAYRVYKQEVRWNSDGGWIFQPGVFSDHPEYKYAGNSEVRSGIGPAPIPGLSLDSMHSLRYPLWIRSEINAYDTGSEQRSYYERLFTGLNAQFFNKVLVPPDDRFACYRLNNYMDGHNGVYRMNYQSLGQGNGYGPYGVSGSLLVGWWAFLETPQSRDLFQNLARTFPWPKECIDLYLGPVGVHPDSAFDPEATSMRLWHFLVLLDAKF